MFWRQFIFYMHLWVEIIRVQSNTSLTENLVDEYYTTTKTMTSDYIPQDELDAQTMMDSNLNDKTVASILLYREKMRRYAIGEKIKEKYKFSGSNQMPTDLWFSNTYILQYTSTGDLYFALAKDENHVLAQYLRNFFSCKDETWIIIAFVLTKDTERMIASFNLREYYDGEWETFNSSRKKQRRPFRNMLRVWADKNRELIETEQLNFDSVSNDAKALKKEQDSKDGWHEVCRDQLELILMKKSIKYARAVIEEFEKANGGRAIEDIINDHIESHNLNHDLADAYSSLARYIKNKHKYIARILYQYTTCDTPKDWAVWIMCVAVVHPQEWAKIDEVFKKEYKEDALVQFLLQNVSDKMLAEMLAVIVDPKFKPTMFSQKLIQGVPANKPAR